MSGSPQRKYERTIRGFIMRCYANMKNRVLGRSKPHIYKGLSILSREEFYTYTLDDVAFNRLYRRWVAADYDRRLTPSVNRINPDLGYDKNNIEWVASRVNSSLARKSPTAARLAIERLACLG